MSAPWSHITTCSALIAQARLEFARTRGGSTFLPHEVACVDGKLGAAWHAELYYEDPNKVEGFIFAAHAMFSIIKGHCLKDGNKRLAWIALVESLASIEFSVCATEQDAYDFCTQLCLRADASAGDVQRWLLDGRLRQDWDTAETN